MFNHLEKKISIANKHGLIKSLAAYYQQHEPARAIDYNVFDTTPTTFVIERSSTTTVGLNEFILLQSKFKDLARGNLVAESLPAKHCSQNIWLVKPASLNRGRGIAIMRRLRDI